nr:MAG TPA: hypothetical protein [Caudoviricetes sp.]
MCGRFLLFFHFSCSLFSWLHRQKFVCTALETLLLENSFAPLEYHFFATGTPPLL